MTKNSDSVRRPARSRRVLVDVQHRMPRGEVYRAFLHHAVFAERESHLHVTPTVESLSGILIYLLGTRGWQFLDHWTDETGVDRHESSQAAKDFAEHCTARLWNSKRIVVKDG